MLIRPLSPSDREQWLALRMALWPDQSPATHAADMAAILSNPWRHAVFVSVGEDGRLNGFVEVSLREYAEGKLAKLERQLAGDYAGATLDDVDEVAGEAERDQAVGLGERERPQEDGVEGREYDRVRADAERQQRSADHRGVQPVVHLGGAQHQQGEDQADRRDDRHVLQAVEEEPRRADRCFLRRGFRPCRVFAHAGVSVQKAVRRSRAPSRAVSFCQCATRRATADRVAI